MTDNGFFVAIGMCIAMFAGLMGYEQGKNIIEQDCNVLGKFSSGTTVYECKKVKE